MNAEIEKLITSVKEVGSMTARQKEIILSKAKQLGDDIDEVEFVLEDVPIRDASNSGVTGSEKRRKCPNCGAVISDNRLTCPECGYVFGKESTTGVVMRNFVNELEMKLKSVDERDDIDFQQKEILKSSIIGAFVVPTTKEALIQLFTYAYGSYIRTKDVEESILGPAWLGKARNAYLLLKSQPRIDAETNELLNSYSFIENEKFKQKKELTNTWWFWLVVVAFFGCVAVMAIFAD